MRKKVSYLSELNCYFFECPHCNGSIIVDKNEINCQIFRHACLKSNGNQLQAHTSKEGCDQAIKDDLVHGCAKPIKLVYEGADIKFAIKDDYN